MKKFILAIILILFASSFVLAEDVTGTTNTATIQPLQILEQQISNSNLAFIGIHEPISVKNLIIVVCLILMIMFMIYDLMSSAGFIENNFINLGISIIITLVGTYGGIAYMATKYLSSLSNTLLSSTKSSTLELLLILVIIIAVFLMLKFTTKFTRKESEKEKEEDRNSKLETLRKIQNIQIAGAGLNRE